jgi:hypothetical protein
MMRFVYRALAASCFPMALFAQTRTLPAGLDPATRISIERVIDSARAAGLPVDPLYAKVAEGKLKQATDAQITGAVRALAGRFRAIRSELGPGMDVAAMTAAATALSVGIPIASIRDLRDAATGSRNASADLAGALVAAADLVTQRVSPASAATAVQSLLARRAAPEQFARLRAGVGETIAAGRSPDQAARAASDAIVKTLPQSPASAPAIRPPLDGDGAAGARVPLAPTNTRSLK